jgi:glycine/D-amino acid oxidase-like deaminating enzyme
MMKRLSSSAPRPAFVRYALAAALISFAAWVGRATSCDDRLPGIILLPANALQFLCGVGSRGWAVAAWIGHDMRKALADLRDGGVLVLSIPAADFMFCLTLDGRCG